MGCNCAKRVATRSFRRRIRPSIMARQTSKLNMLKQMWEDAKNENTETDKPLEPESTVKNE